MPEDKIYWLQPPYRCPICDRPFRKPVAKALYDGNKENALPIWKCSTCGNQFISYLNSKIAVQFPEISTEYLHFKGSAPDFHQRGQEDKESTEIERQRAAWLIKKNSLQNPSPSSNNINAIKASSAKISDQNIYNKAISYLHNAYGPDSSFRDGQYEAIEATLTNKRTLLVQKTGWGKSLIYFIVTKIIREKNHGATVVVSPLLALMENQQEAATKLGLSCDSLNSQTTDKREEIINKLIEGKLDLVLVTPETLFKEDIQKALPRINIGLFVIDEAHCISDWGHDFRLEYCRLKNVIKAMSDNVPILATTATANNRVIADLKTQLGDNVYISRGSLLRNNLAIQVLKLPDKAARYAWLLENIPTLPGTGIIYCLTQRDCISLAGFLQENGIKALSYFSRSQEEEQINQSALEQFMHNDIKVLVATIKLGMGFDKGDVSFIVHFQMPANVVTYYQQIGRAGRNIPMAYTFLMAGSEDIDIHNYFIRKAFPEEQDMRSVYSIISRNDGIGVYSINSCINIGKGQLDKILAFLINDGYIYKVGSKYYSVGKAFHYDRERYEAIRQIRHEEINQMFGLLETTECYNRYIINLLNDETKGTCGCCSNCIGELRKAETSFDSKNKAAEYLNDLVTEITPRKKWPLTKYTSSSKIPVINQVGICISRYGDPGFGELVRKGKYPVPTRFDEKLVQKGFSLLKPIVRENDVRFITCVPSLRSGIVADYTKRLAKLLEIQYLEALRKKPADQQKNMENSSYQCANALESFYIDSDIAIPEKIILVDDIVDSKWTLTVCGHLLCDNGCSWVFPFALAESSRRDDI